VALSSLVKFIGARTRDKAFDRSQVSRDYIRSLQVANELLKNGPSNDVLEDVEAELEAKAISLRYAAGGGGGGGGGEPIPPALQWAKNGARALPVRVIRCVVVNR
jgi:hypothetical protein